MSGRQDDRPASSGGRVDIEALRPADTPEWMTPAWLSCVMSALRNDEIVAAFRKDTGNTWKPAKSPFDRAIDKATGVEKDFLEQFIRWANEHVWGPMDAEIPNDA